MSHTAGLEWTQVQDTPPKCVSFDSFWISKERTISSKNISLTRIKNDAHLLDQVVLDDDVVKFWWWHHGYLNPMAWHWPSIQAAFMANSQYCWSTKFPWNPSCVWSISRRYWADSGISEGGSSSWQLISRKTSSQACNWSMPFWWWCLE